MKALCAVVLSSVLALCFVGIGCTPPSRSSSGRLPDPAGSSSNPSTNTLTIFLTGNVLSMLQPCGCSSGQLGGFDRRGAVLAAVPADRRLIVDTGNLLADDTGAPGQDMIKLGIILQAMAMLQYDVVKLSPDDLAAVASVGMIEGGVYSFITPADKAASGPGTAYSKKFELAGNALEVTVASAQAERLDANSIQSLFNRSARRLNLNILIVDDCSENVKALLENSDSVDVVICPTAADEPRVLDRNRRKPLFVSVGRLGKYVARLTAELTDNNQLKLAFDKLPVDESLPQDENLVQLYRDYQLMLRDERLLEKHPRVPLPNDLKYLGNESCRSCHDYEYEKWSTKGHAHAYETLVEVGSQYDPECIRCHVVGFGYESGFINEESPKTLRDVGCEVCHGPGSDHLKALTTGRLDKGISEPMAGCIDCHNPDHSPAYQGHEDEFLQKIKHWREPGAPDDVK